MRSLTGLSRKEFHMLKLNAVLRQPSIEKIAEVTGRDEMELYEIVKDIQSAIVNTFKVGTTDYQLQQAIKKEHINRLKKDEEREESLRKLRFKSWKQSLP